MRLLILVATIFVCTQEFGFASYLLDEDVEDLDVNNFVCNDANLTLNFTGTDITRVNEGFIVSPLITCLNFEHNNIRIVAEGAFKHVPNLEHLNLASNVIRSSELFWFGGHEKLRSLIIKMQREIYDPYGIRIPEPYPNLEYLDLSGNRVENINYGPAVDDYNSYYRHTPRYDAALDGFKFYFPRLKYLDLSNNDLRGDVMLQMSGSSLKYLYLQNNGIESLSNAAYPELIVLALDNNQILGTRSFLPYYPAKFPKLINLTLANNKLNFIDRSMFIRVPRLEHLDLSNNGMSTIEDGSFDNLKHLRNLLLDENQLSSLPSINEPLNITSLSAKCNNIESLTVSTFGNLPFLTELYLDNNLISNIDADTFASLSSLTVLHLAGNKLSSLPNGWSNSLEDLQYLDLSFNEFISLDAIALSPGINLQDLRLANHTLKYLNSNSFENLPPNLHIDLEPIGIESFASCKTKQENNNYY